MSVVVDTNVYIRFLLGTSVPTPPSKVVVAGIEGDFSVVCSERLIGEIRRNVSTKPYLAARNPPAELNLLINTLKDQAIFVPDDFEELPEPSRDRDDDFLIMIALLKHADYFVSDDPDLKVIGEFEGVRIVSPAEFVTVLDLSCIQSAYELGMTIPRSSQTRATYASGTAYRTCPAYPAVISAMNSELRIASSTASCTAMNSGSSRLSGICAPSPTEKAMA